MAFDFHSDRNKYFQLQYNNTKTSILPFIDKVKPIHSRMRILEIGCRDGGVLKCFSEVGCRITGFDLEEGPIRDAQERYAEAIAKGDAEFFVMNVHDYILENKNKEEAKFDLVILKDVIEHIHGREKFMAELKYLLKPKGVVFFGFPPWMNPFGGHQQVLSHRILSKIPYIHLLPDVVYHGLMKVMQPSGIPFVKDIKATRITIETFESLVERYHFKILNKCLYLVAPMYQYKFGLRPRKQWSALAATPWLRNFFTTDADYVICLEENKQPDAFS